MISFTLFRLFAFVLMLLPRAWRRNLFCALADTAYRFDQKHRRVIRANLDFAFDKSLSDEEVKDIGRYCYRNLALALLQVLENHRMSKKELGSKVSFMHEHYVDEAKESGRPIIFITAHFGNWEIGGPALGSQVIPNSAVHKALNNEHFSRYLKEARARFDLNMVEKHGAVKHLSKALKKGEAISMLIDQNTNRRDGIVINFFGKTARQTPAPAQLARKYNAVVIPLLIRTEDHENHTITFYKPIEVANSGDSAKDVLEATQKMADWLEGEIRKEPKFWFWVHRRWKAEHPEIYR